MRSWQVVGGLMVMWVVMMIYMSSTLMGTGGENSSRLERQLRRAMDELEQLHGQNIELQKLASELKSHGNVGGNQGDVIKKLQERLLKATGDLERLSTKHLGDFNEPNEHDQVRSMSIPQNECPLTLDREQSRRKVENTAVELWYYVNAKMKELAKVSENSGAKSFVQTMRSELHGYQTVMMDDFLSLRQADQDEDWRLKESLQVGKLVQSRIEYLQNPKDCDSAKMVLCDLQKGCGFGCQLHHVTYCLIVAYATQRTLILHSKGWRYASGGWDTVFQPLSSTCTKTSGVPVHWGAASSQLDKVKVVQLPIVDSLYPRPEFMPLAIPEDLAPRLLTFHGDAPVWWIGQFVSYLMRPNKHLQDEISAAAEKIKFQRPIVGVHIRRTDKVGVEAAFHSLEEYMHHVDAYYTQREHHDIVTQRRVYLATDDPAVLNEARKKYTNYEFVSDNGISKSAGLGSRYTDSSLRGIIMDIHFLSQTDYLVCTFSSQVCRVAYELMQTMHGDASKYFHSLDDSFYYGGQNAHNLRATDTHRAASKNELSFEIGDLLGIAGNHWDGFSKGTHRKSGKTGLYPSYKLVNDIVSVKMPTYPEVKEEEVDIRKKRGAGEGVAVDYGHR